MTSPREVGLGPVASEAVRAGRIDLPLDWVHHRSGLVDGAIVVARDAEGGEVGLAIADVENGLLRLMARVDEGAGALDAAWIGGRVDAAITRRRALGLEPGEGAFRLLNGAADGLAGLTADVYGPWAVVHTPSRAMAHLALETASACVGQVPLRGAIVKVRSRGAASSGAPRQAVVGAMPPDRLIVSEGDLRFEVHLVSGLNVGLFTDMRDHRRAIRGWAGGRRVLNTFAYTASLSVAAAAGGASAVTSVDLSSGVLRWARDNFRLNGFGPGGDRFRFEVADVGAFLDSALAGGASFDAVMIDPPSYSTARGASFSVDRDYSRLITTASGLLTPGGIMWLAANTRGLPLADLATRGIEGAGRRARPVASGGLPPDFPTLPAQPEDAYLQVLTFEVE